MYHEGQRASEAMCNGIKHKYITCLALSLLLCHEGSGLLRQLSSGQPTTLFPMERHVYYSVVEQKSCFTWAERMFLIPKWDFCMHLHAHPDSAPAVLHAWVSCPVALRSRHVIRTQWPGTRAHSAGQVSGKNSPIKPNSVGRFLQWIGLSLGINISFND